MQNLIFTESKFKKMALRLAREQRKSGVDLPHQSVLQMLSRAIFDKPYEEVKATSFAAEMPTLKPVNALKLSVNPVYTMLHYGEETILLRNQDYVSGNYPGTDLHVPNRIFLETAQGLAKAAGGELFTEYLPQILPEGYETDDVINLAKKLGMLNGFDSIYNLIETSSVIKIDGRVTEYTLGGEYIDEVETAFENGECPLDVCIWMPETADRLGLHEYYFTLGELSKARTSDGGKTWFVGDFVVGFYK